MNLKRKLVVSFLVTGLSWSAGGFAAGDATDALRAWHGGEREAAIAAWQALAERGDADAALYLGHAYSRGLGVDRDSTIAASWYRVAAELGSPEAQFQLALMYELGIGVARDTGEAARWYGLSSAQACPSELRSPGVLGE